MAGSGRRRQAPTPLRRRMRLDLLGWGALAGAAAAVVLGLTGGGWVAAVVLGLLVVAGFAVLSLLAATSARRPGRARSGTSPESPAPPSGEPPLEPPRERPDVAPDP